MFLVLLLLTLCLHTVDCPGWQPRTGAMTHGGGWGGGGGGCTTPSPGFLPGAPGASGGGNSGGTSPGGHKCQRGISTCYKNWPTVFEKGASFESFFCLGGLSFPHLSYLVRRLHRLTVPQVVPMASFG